MFFYNEGDSEVSQEQGSPIVTEGLQLHLDAGDTNSYSGTGTTWYDLSGNGNNATLVNGVSYSSQVGGELIFDGINQYADIAQNDIYKFANTDPFTLSIWCKITASSWAQIITFSKSGTSGLRGYYLTFDKNAIRSNSFLFDYWDGGPYRGIQGASNSITTDTWINIVATSENNTVSGMKVYQNGILTSFTNRGTGTPSSINYDSLTMRIGARGDDPSYFKGNMSNIMIYNRALSQEEITQNFEATKSRFGL